MMGGLLFVYFVDFLFFVFFFFQAEDGIRDLIVTGVQTCALPICRGAPTMPRRSGIGMVGAPRLTTIASPLPGASAVPAGGRVSIARPDGAAAWTDSTWLTTSPAAATSDCASVASRPETSGTGILGGPALDTRVTFVPSGAMTPGGGSCQMTMPAGAVGCGSAPPSVTCSLDFCISACASGTVSPNTRGTAWWPGRSGAGKR